MPASHAIAAAIAARHQEAPAAYTSTGSGAIQTAGHQGCIPVPSQTSAAVSTTATMAAPARRRSCADAMQIPPDAAPDQGAKLTRATADASAEVEHHEALQQRTELERDLPGVVGPQLASRHAVLQRRGERVGGRRAPGLEVARVAAGALA